MCCITSFMQYSLYILPDGYKNDPRLPVIETNPYVTRVANRCYSLDKATMSDRPSRKLWSLVKFASAGVFLLAAIGGIITGARNATEWIAESRVSADVETDYGAVTDEPDGKDQPFDSSAPQPPSVQPPASSTTPTTQPERYSNVRFILDSRRAGASIRVDGELAEMLPEADGGVSSIYPLVRIPLSDSPQTITVEVDGQEVCTTRRRINEATTQISPC